MTKRRNVSVMTTAGMANNSAIVPRWNLAFSVAPRAYQSEFYIDNGSCTRSLIALHSQSGSRIPLEYQLARVCRIFPCFIVFKFNDVLALRCLGLNWKIQMNSFHPGPMS
jgi:hypothetical protein